MKYRIDNDLRERLPAQTKEEHEDLAEKIEAEGVRPGAIVVGNIRGDHVLIDGHHTEQICKAKHIPLPEPVVLDFESKEDAIDWMRKNQLARRNLSDIVKQQMREERIHRVADARRNGQSLRTIAKAEGMSYQTIADDLKRDGVNPVDTMPPEGKVTGSDGVQQPATKPKERILCPGCATRVRKGQDVEPKCRECRSLRALAKSEKKGDANLDADPVPDAPAAPPMDDLGNEIPKKLRDTFAGNRKALQDGIKLLFEVRRMCKDLTKWNPYLRACDLETATTKLAEDLKNGLPYAVCKHCEGKGCTVCRKQGWGPKWLQAEMSK